MISNKMALQLWILILSISFSPLLHSQNGSARKVLVENFIPNFDSRYYRLADTVNARANNSILINYERELWDGEYSISTYRRPRVRLVLQPLYPSGNAWYINGKSTTFDSVAMTNSWASVTTMQIDSAASVPSPFDISVSHSYHSSYDTMIIVVEVVCTQDIQEDSLRLWIAPIQNNLPRGFFSNPDFQRRYINSNWDILPDTGAINLHQNWVVGQRVQFSYRWPMNYVYKINDMSVVAFIQNFQTKEILQAAQSATVNVPLADIRIVSGIRYNQSDLCDLNYNPEVSFFNQGLDTVRNIELEYFASRSGIKRATWLGTLLPGQNISYQLPQDTFGGDRVNYLNYRLLRANGKVDNSLYNNYTVSKSYLRLNNNTKLDSVIHDFEQYIFVAQEFPNYIVRQVAIQDRNTGVINNVLKFNYREKNWSMREYLGAYTTFGVRSRDWAVTDSAKFKYAAVPGVFICRNGTDYFPCITTDSNQIDTFAFQATMDCGQNWITLWQKSGRDLMTTNYTDTSSLADRHWRTVKVSLASIIGEDVHFRFINRCNGMSQVYIDDIDIRSLSLPPPHDFSINPFPNPTDGRVFFDFALNTSFQVKTNVHSALGQQMLDEKIHTISQGISTISRDLSTLEKGCYYLTVEYPSGFRRSWPVVKL